MKRRVPESERTWTGLIQTTPPRGPSSPRRARRVISDEDAEFLQSMEQTHLAKEPDITDLLGETRHLKLIGRRATLNEYFIELWQRRHFIWRESKNRVFNKSSNTVLGPLWLVASPLLNAAFYWVIFGIVLGVSRGMDNFVAFIIIGVLMFQYSSGVISQSPKAIAGAKSMIRAFSYPRASIPISLVIRELLAHLIVVVVMLIMILAIPPHVTPDLTWLLLPLVFVFQTVINLGIAFIFSRLGYKVPDVAQAMSFVTRLLMYGSGVIFPVERFVQNETALAIVKANPIYMLLDAYRSILMDNTLPSTGTWMGLIAWAVGLFTFGFIYFWRAEEEYAREPR